MPLTTSEAAKRAGIGKRHIVRLINSGDIEASRTGRAWRIDEAVFDAWLAKYKARPKHRGPDIWFYGHYQDEDQVKRKKLGAAIRKIELSGGNNDS